MVRGGVTVKLGAFLGWGVAVLKIFGAGASQGSHFLQGRGGAGRASLVLLLVSCCDLLRHPFCLFKMLNVFINLPRRLILN